MKNNKNYCLNNMECLQCGGHLHPLEEDRVFVCEKCNNHYLLTVLIEYYKKSTIRPGTMRAEPLPPPQKSSKRRTKALGVAAFFLFLLVVMAIGAFLHRGGLHEAEAASKTRPAAVHAAPPSSATPETTSHK